jgi:hypothetical protein
MGGHGAALTPREEPLLGGNVTAGLVRVGDTVRRPAGPMAHPDATTLGIRPPTLTAIGRLARDLHDALDGWVPPADAVWHVAIEPDTEDLVVHHDQGHRTGHQPWARMWDEGHGSVWRRDAEWIEEHGVVLRAALTR